MFSALPLDNFGIYVRTELDRHRLLWAVNQIGETKLRTTAGKKDKRHPERNVSVREVLRRFHLKVPRSFYPKSFLPVFRVYVLVLRDHSALKIGFTSAWPSRAYAFVHTQDDAASGVRALFDENQSVAFEARSAEDARLLEKTAKQLYTPLRVPSPYHRGLIPFGAGGHMEWFEYSIYDELCRYLSNDRPCLNLATIPNRG
jgi:hypothetical protein